MVFKIFKNVFILFLMLCFCSHQNINVQNYKYDAFHSYKQIVFCPVFHLYHNHGYIITFITFCL